MTTSENENGGRVDKPVLELSKVTKRYERLTAVSDLSLRIMSGEIFGLLGSNGAGKTSVIRMMLGIVAPDTGTIRLFGNTVDRESLRHAGYLPEERGLYPKMSVRDNLPFLGELNGLDSIAAQ